MPILKLTKSITLLLVSATLASCAGCSLDFLSGRGREVTLLAYNVENLFDDVHNGTEYREYDPAAGEWTTELFHIKMQHLAEVLRSGVQGGADVVCLEEIENVNVLETLNETYLKGMGYRPLAAESGRTSITVGLLSRLPVTALRMHRLVSSESDTLRDVMEVHLDCRGRPLVLFVNHWKSKLGSAQDTEPDRRAAAALVVRRAQSLAVEDPEAPVVVAGDLNECWDEYMRIGCAYVTALLPDTEEAAATTGRRSVFITSEPAAARIDPDRVVLFSPWSERGQDGSYCYDGEWETIDHTLVGPRLFDGAGLEYRSFDVVRPGFLLTSEGYPFRWNSDRATGYSDHLPILLTLSIVS